MKKFAVIAFMLMMVCGAASADVVYTTANGDLGLVEITKSSSTVTATNKGTQYESKIPGATISSFWENNTSNGNGNSKLILVSPDVSPDNNVSGDRAYIFSASSLSKPDDEEPVILTGTFGTPKIVKTETGNTLYAASDDALREYMTSNFTVRQSYTPTSKDLGITTDPKIKDLIIDTGTICALIERNATSGDVLMYFSGALEKGSQITIKHPAHAINFVNSGIAVGHDSGVVLVSGSASKDVEGITGAVTAICRDTSAGFYYVVSGDGLYHYDGEKTTTSSALTSGNGTLLNAGDNVLAAIIGDNLELINMENDNTIATLNVAPTSIAVRTATGQSGGSGGSGCNLGGVGIILMMSLCVMKVKKS
ncbi:MAG: hypothetical protein IJU31_00730 [Synergistaceae bacterium]|nr:hypothetical protein [Synergistaceae bacterium]